MKGHLRRRGGAWELRVYSGVALRTGFVTEAFGQGVPEFSVMNPRPVEVCHLDADLYPRGIAIPRQRSREARAVVLG
jgi:hypothetical protein